jgi:competence protein ComEC
VRCDSLACLLSGKGGILTAHVLDAAAFPEDCRRADAIVTKLKAPADCAARLVIDGPQLERFGAHAVRVSKGGSGPAFVVTTATSAFPRPWQAGGQVAAEAVNISAEDP